MSTRPNNLKVLRKIHQLTQAQVAEILNVDRSTYAYYESGKTLPSIETLAVFSKIYKVSLEFFMSPPFSAGNPPRELFRCTPKETRVLCLFRMLDEENQEEAIRFLQERLEAKDE